jgi:hypothetical protein
MRKRLRVVTGLSAALGVSAFVVVWLVLPRDRISESNCEQIREGMTLPEVEAVLGGPAGAYTSDGKDWSMGMLKGGLRQIGHTVQAWVGDDGGIRIHFDRAERVAAAQWCPRRVTFFARVRAWVRL